jgi:radical SAM superfamily enzyme YgiQ (UPF0313 family)
MVRAAKKILLINPWIYDFAAYDLWAKPLGLLSLGGSLRTRGHRVFLIDCLDVHSPWMAAEGKAKPPRKPHHCGKFFEEPVEKPLPLTSVPRTYSRYGLTEKAFWRGLQEIERPDLVLVTSLMTYWYPGPFRVIELVKQAYPKTTVILGGLYATLCYEHAVAKSGADIVFAGGGVDRALALIDEVLNTHPQDDRQASYPVFDLYSHLDSVCLVTSRGCPYRCLYCASSFLEDSFSQRRPGDAVDEITHWVERFHVTDIAFYDDALSIDASNHFVPILQEVLERDLRCRFHLPNGIHARSLTRETADLMFRAGFKTIRLGLETIDPLKQIETGGKVDGEDIRRAIAYLRGTGFSRQEVGVYLMAGLPVQPWNEVERGIDKVWEWGATPKIAEYSPIPHTPLWEEAVRYSPYDLEGEPLFQNNSLLPCHWEGFSWEDLAGINTRLQKRLRDETVVRSIRD